MSFLAIQTLDNDHHFNKKSNTPTKRVKLEENLEKEISLKNTKDKKDNIDMDALNRRINKTLQNNSVLCEKLENLKKNYDRVSSSSKADEVEISKRQEKVPNTPSNRSQSSLNHAHNMQSPQLPTLGTLPVPKFNNSSLKDNQRYFSALTRLLLGSQSPVTQVNPLSNIITPDTQVLVKSIVMQDLFTNAFKRYLHSSKGTIMHNLQQSMGTEAPIQAPLPLNVLRRHSEAKRKNTDPITSETIESDLNLPQWGSQASRATPVQHRGQSSLSAFFPTQKGRSMSLNAASNKHIDDKWDPREEKKQ